MCRDPTDLDLFLNYANLWFRNDRTGDDLFFSAWSSISNLKETVCVSCLAWEDVNTCAAVCVLGVNLLAAELFSGEARDETLKKFRKVVAAAIRGASIVFY